MGLLKVFGKLLQVMPYALRAIVSKSLF